MKSDQATLLHQSKQEFIQIQDNMRNEIQALKRERDSCENRLKQALLENDENLEQLQHLTDQSANLES